MTDSTHIIPLPAESGVTGQTTGSAVAKVERPQISQLSLGQEFGTIASAHATALGPIGSDFFALFGRAHDELTRLKVENAVLKTENKNLRGNRRLAKLLIAAGTLLVGLGFDRRESLELAVPLVLAGLVIATVGWLLGPKGGAS